MRGARQRGGRRGVESYTGPMGGLDTGMRLAAMALAWLAGTALHLQQAGLAAPPSQAMVVLAAVLVGAVAARHHRHALGFVVLLVALAGLAFGAAGVQASMRLADRLDPALEGIDLELTGVVASLPQRNEAGVRFRFEVERATRAGRPVQVPARLALGWTRGWHEDAAAGTASDTLRAGQRWRLTVRLRRPHGNLNPQGYDFELALFEQGVRATGYVRDGPAVLLDGAAGHPVERLRERLRDAIQAHVPERRAAGVIAALAVGDQAAIEREDWDLFRQTGVAHLMSISGLHVTMFAWLAGGLAGAGWRRSVRAMAWWPAATAARWIGLAAACGYAVFSGGGVPAQRTVWMLATVTLLSTLGLHWPWPLVLLAAAVVVTVPDPWALLQPGFWLSFVAVGLLMASAPVRPASGPGPPPTPLRRLGRLLRDGLRTQGVATLGLAPLTLIFFQQLSLVGFPANLVAIPVVTLLVAPLALLGSVFAPAWTLAASAVQQLCAGLERLAAWPGSGWAVPAAPAWVQALGLLAAALAIGPLPWRLRCLAVPLAVPMLWPAAELPPPGEFEATVVDVGQGTAVLVRTASRLLVYDAGPQYTRDSDAGQRVLLPLLRARGETRIDALVLSHRDTDHVGGARALLAAMAPARLISSVEPWHPLLAGRSGVERCEAGQSWTWDGVRFEMLRPEPGDYPRGLRPNAMSCVLRVESARGAALLLAGDIEREQEAALVAAPGAPLRSAVLVVPHHGSRTSSTPAFVAAVQPRVAVVQAGYRSRFGHPVPEVVQRYRDAGATVRTSAACGAWRWRSESGTETALAPQRCERHQKRRYWHLHLSDDAPP